ncbi:MAG: hypothetical protein PVH38_13080 [Gammaproteobacteria bacterium]|jgi:hypothetical protein
MKTGIALVVLLPAGCSTTTGFPDNRALVEPTHPVNCTSIDAVFSCFGQKTNGKKPLNRAHLGAILLPGFPQAGVTRLSVRLATDAPSVTAWAGGDLYETRAIPADKLECNAATWRLQNDATDWRPMVDMYSLMLASAGAYDYERRYSQAADGALIVEETRHSVGVIFLIPASLREKEWYRFPPAGTPAGDNDPAAPGAVLQAGSGYTRLPPPEHLDRGESGKTMYACLDLAYAGVANLTSGEQTLLEGHSTQALLAQHDPHDKPFLNTEWINRKQGYVPSTGKVRLRKPHWLQPGVSDQYVLCLLDAGYSWQGVAATE